LAGELTIGRQPPSGTRQQQQAMVDAFGALSLPTDKTIISAAHLKTGKVYTKVCENEKCTMNEMAEPEQACLTENWSGCQYLAMQFREKQYCFLTPSDQCHERHRMSLWQRPDEARRLGGHHGREIQALAHVLCRQPGPRLRLPLLYFSRPGQHGHQRGEPLDLRAHRQRPHR